MSCSVTPCEYLKSGKYTISKQARAYRSDSYQLAMAASRKGCQAQVLNKLRIWTNDWPAHAAFNMICGTKWKAVQQQELSYLTSAIVKVISFMQRIQKFCICVVSSTCAGRTTHINEPYFQWAG